MSRTEQLRGLAFPFILSFSCQCFKQVFTCSRPSALKLARKLLSLLSLTASVPVTQRRERRAAASVQSAVSERVPLPVVRVHRLIAPHWTREWDPGRERSSCDRVPPFSEREEPAWKVMPFKRQADRRPGHL